MVNANDRRATKLDELDKMLASGQLTRNQYDVRRANILAEAAKSPRGAAAQILIPAAVIVGIFLVLAVIGGLWAVFS